MKNEDLDNLDSYLDKVLLALKEQKIVVDRAIISAKKNKAFSRRLVEKFNQFNSYLKVEGHTVFILVLIISIILIIIFIALKDETVDDKNASATWLLNIGLIVFWGFMLYMLVRSAKYILIYYREKNDLKNRNVSTIKQSPVKFRLVYDQVMRHVKVS